jgi:hypothetical protein
MADLGTTSSSARFDFSNPWFAANIVTKDGTSFPLWTNFAGGSPGSTPALATQGSLETIGLGSTKALSFLQELTIENNLGNVPKITAILSPPYLDAINLLDSGLIEWGSSRLEVFYGYLSNTTNEKCVSTIFSGILIQPDIQFGVDVTVTLNAQGVSSFGATRQGGTRTFKNATRKDIIEAIAHGRTAKPFKLESTDLGPLKGGDITKSAVNLGSNSQFKLKSPRLNLSSLPFKFLQEGSKLTIGARTVTDLGPETREVNIVDDEVTKNEEADRLYSLDQISYTQGGRKDFQAIDILATQCQCNVLWIGSDLHLIPRDTIMKGDVKRYFRLYGFPGGSVGPSAGVFPIFSVSSPAVQLWASGTSRGILQQDTDSKTRLPVRNYTDDNSAKPTRTSEGVATLGSSRTMPSHDPNTGDGASTLPGSPSDPSARADAKAEYRKSTNNMGVILTVESFADPSLRPGDKIGVRGLGYRLDGGTYAVHKQTITIGSSGATMSLETISNTSGVVGVKAKGKEAANPAPKPTDAKLHIEPETGTGIA